MEPPKMWFLGFVLLVGLVSWTEAESGHLEPLELSKNKNCSKCELLVTLFDLALIIEEVDDCVEWLIIFICEIVAQEDDTVCTGISDEFGPEGIWILWYYLKQNPDNLCGLFKGLDCNYDANVLDFRWPITLPGIKPPHVAPALPSPNAQTMKVLHLSDLHIDPEYTIGEQVDCGEPQCCRVPGDNIEAIKTQEKGSGTAQKWGTIGNCDLPYWTAMDMLEQITTNHKNIDYVVVSGDLESHAVWTYTMGMHKERIQNVSKLLLKYFPNTPVYFAIGNHEGVPIDNLAPHLSYIPKNFSYQPLYDTIAEAWGQWVPADQQDVVKYRGSYMVKVTPGLRLISLNTLYGDPVNFWLVLNQTDPDGTMTWLIDQLAIAEYYGDKVQIVAHIPGADSEAYEGWAINYYNVINRFEDTVVGQFFGHTHSEQYYMMYEDPEDHTSRPTSVIYSAPSATTYSDYNPAYRIYTIDGNYTGSTYQVLDWEEYYLNLTQYGNDTTTTWEPVYSSVKATYNLTDLSPASWGQLADRLLNDTGLMQTYLRNFYRRTDSARPHLTCDTNCTKDFVCSIRKAHHSTRLCSDLGIEDHSVDKPMMYRKKFKKADDYDEVDVLDIDELLKIAKSLEGKYPRMHGKDASKCLQKSTESFY